MNVKRGQIYYADLRDGTIGSEQSGIRPVLIIQNDTGNKHSPTTICSIITSKTAKHDLPTHVSVGAEFGLQRESIVMLEQLRTIDKLRLREKLGELNQDKINEVNMALMVSVGI